MPRRTAVELIFIVLIIIKNNNNNSDTVYGAVIMNRHCESSPGSFDECRLSAGLPPTRIPSQSTWAVSPPKIGCHHLHRPSPLLLLLGPQADTHLPSTEGGRLSRPRHCSRGVLSVPKANAHAKHQSQRSVGSTAITGNESVPKL